MPAACIASIRRWMDRASAASKTPSVDSKDSRLSSTMLSSNPVPAGGAVELPSC